MEESEPRNDTLQSPLMRRMSRSDSYTQEDKISTEFGTVVVAVQGDRTRNAVFTYHDIGLNHVSNFQAFFALPDTRMLFEGFCIYHINAPGQEEDAATFPNGYSYPSMDKLSDMLLGVCHFYKIKHFIGFGVGAGANILSRFAMQHREYVDGLFLVNATCTASGWTEWGYQKLNAMHLRTTGMTNSIQDYLMWHHFGKSSGDGKAKELFQMYRQYFTKAVNPYNLSLYIDSYIRRTDLNLVRDSDTKKKDKNFKCHVLLMAGSNSPHLEDTVTMNGKLNPNTSTWMKLSDCGMPLEEQPAKVCEALHLFLQGLGHIAGVSRRRSSVVAPLGPSEGTGMFRRRSSAAASVDPTALASLRQGGKKQPDNKQHMNITENPISSLPNS